MDTKTCSLGSYRDVWPEFGHFREQMVSEVDGWCL